MEFDVFWGGMVMASLSRYQDTMGGRSLGLPKSGWACVLYLNAMYLSAVVHYTEKNRQKPSSIELRWIGYH